MYWQAYDDAPRRQSAHILMLRRGGMTFLRASGLFPGPAATFSLRGRPSLLGDQTNDVRTYDDRKAHFVFMENDDLRQVH
jgi:hypothetical protein